jgi:hypothetical protein
VVSQNYAITLTFLVCARLRPLDVVKQILAAQALGLTVSVVAFTNNHVIQMSILPEKAYHKPGPHIAYFSDTNMLRQAEYCP